MWHFESEGQAVGPVSPEEIQNYINTGRVTAETRVWRAGFSDWMPAGQTELAAAFQRPAPPPIGAPAYSQPSYSPPPSYAPQPSYSPPPNYAPAPPMYPGAAPQYGGYPAGQFAGFWIRFGAYLIDSIIIGVVMGVLFAIVIGMVAGMMNSASSDDQGTAIGLATVFFYLVEFVVIGTYFTAFTASKWQATPGKRLVGIYVVRADGQRVGAGLAFGRWLSYFISSLIFYVGFFMIGFTDQKQGLHDMICGTRVVFGKL